MAPGSSGVPLKPLAKCPSPPLHPNSQAQKLPQVAWFWTLNSILKHSQSLGVVSLVIPMAKGLHLVAPHLMISNLAEAKPSDLNLAGSDRTESQQHRGP